MCNPNSRKLGSLQPLASAKRKRAESPLQSALRAAVNRGGAALQPRLLFLQPNRRRSQPIWRGFSVRASLAQNRPNFAPRPFVGYFPPPSRPSRRMGRHSGSQGVHIQTLFCLVKFRFADFCFRQIEIGERIILPIVFVKLLTTHISSLLALIPKSTPS